MSTETKTPADAGRLDGVVRPRAWVGLGQWTRQPIIVFDGQHRAPVCEPWLPLYEVAPLTKDARMEPPLMTALRHAWAGDYRTAESYVLLAAGHMESRGEVDQARYLRAALNQWTGRERTTVVYAA